MAKKVLITGASGYVGAGLYKDLKQKGFEVFGTYNKFKFHEELIHLDVTDKQQIKSVVDDVSPDVLIHNAASPNAAWCEINPEKAVELNENSTEYVCQAFSKKIIFMSSTVVGNAENVYASTKKNSEKIIFENGGIVLRPSLILGMSPNTKNDRPMNRILRILDSHQEPVFDNSWQFYPTYLRQISEVINQLISEDIEYGKPIEIACEKLTTRAEVAMDILKDFDVEIEGKDQGKGTAPMKLDLSSLDELNLPKYTYEEMMSEIRKEVKEWAKENVINNI